MTSPIEEFVVSITTKFDQAGFDKALKTAGAGVNTLAQRLQSAGGHAAIGSRISGAARTLAGRVPGGSTIAGGIEAAAAAGPIGAIFAGIALGALAVGAAAATMAAGVARSFEQLGFQATVAQTSVGSLKAIEFGFTQIGIGAESAAQLVTSLAQSLKYDPGTEGVLNGIGVKTRDANGQLRDTTKITDDLLDKLVTMPPALAAAWAGFFHISRTELDLWRQGGKEAEAAQERLRQKSVQLGVDQGKLADESHAFMTAWRDGLADVELIYDRFSQDTLPSLTKALTAVDKFLTSHFDKIVTVIDHASDTVGSIATRLGDDLGIFDKLVTATIGWKGALEAVAVVISARILGPLGPLLLLLEDLQHREVSADIQKKLDEQDSFHGSLAEKAWKNLQHWLHGSDTAAAPTPGTAAAPTSGQSTAPALTPNTAPAIPPGSSSDPLGIRNNNPGNLRSGAGQVGTNQGFAVFKTPAEGLAALRNLLVRYGQMGVDTVQAIVARYAPPSDNNSNNTAYAGTLDRILGVTSDQHLNLNDPTVLAGLIRGITQFENGRNPYSADLINRAAGGYQTVQHNIQNNNVAVTVEGAADPARTATAVADQQRRIQGNLSRNFAGAVLA